MTTAVRYDKGVGQPVPARAPMPTSDNHRAVSAERYTEYHVTGDSTISDAARALYGVATHETRMRVLGKGFRPGAVLRERV